MPTVGDRIRAARLAKQLSQEELAQRIGRTRVAVSEWERDLTRPRESIVPKLASVLDIPASSLNPFGEGGVASAATQDGNFRIALVAIEDIVKIARGASPMTLAKEFLPADTAVIDPDACFWFECIDSSMAPEFCPGDLVRVDRTREPRDGSYVVALPEGASAVMLRRYVARRGDVFDLVPEAPEFPTVTAYADQPVEIIGVVDKHLRDLTAR
jgi:SOS-response transcriptional repressor LexA